MNITEEYCPVFSDLFNELAQKRKPLRELWIGIDDNEAYFQIGYENRKYFIQQKTEEDIMTGVAGEDIIWLRGYLKNIRYYNVRFLIPQG